MIEKLDCDNVLQIKLPLVIDAFIDFYGKEEKMKITKKFTNSFNVAYITVDRYVNLVDELLKEVTLSAEKYFFKKIGLTFDERLEVNFFGTGAKTLEYTNIDTFFKHIDKNNSVSRAKVYDSIIVMTGKTFKDREDLLQEIEKFKSYKDAYKEAKKYREKLIIERGYKRYIDFENQIEILKETLEKKHNKILLKRLLPFLSEKDNLYYEKHKNDAYFDFSLLESCDIIFSSSGPSINNKMIISYFTSECSNALEKNDTDDSTKFIIKNNRIKYFKQFGFDYGNDYNKYINSKKCIKIMPSEELANTIEGIRRQERSNYMQELILSMPQLKNAIKRKKRKRRIYPDDGFCKTILSGASLVLVNAEKKNQEYELAPLLLFNAGIKKISSESLDARLFKLFNRLYEVIILKQDEKKITYSQGFELKEYYPDKMEAKKLIECKLLNEVVDELIAEEIADKMHKKGNFIFSKKNNSKSFTNTKLELILGPFAKDFYLNFKDEIIDSRKKGKISLLLNVVGQDNFIKYNALLKQIYASYDENTIKVVLSYKAKNIKNEETKKYDRFKLNSNAIIKNMLAYKVKYKDI